MILDSIDNIARYDFLFANEIVAYLRSFQWSDGLPEEIELRGRDLFVRPSAIMTRAPEEGKFETHRIYADVQVVVAGTERMQVSPTPDLAPLTAYDEVKDYRFFKAPALQSITELVVPAGHFALFFPGEAHRPCCMAGSIPDRVNKLVFKVRMM